MFAVILGLILGGVVIYGVFLANRSRNELANATPTPTVDQTSVTITPTIAPGLTITTPPDHSVSFTTPLKITGSTKPNAQVIISDADDQTLVQADATGQFSALIKISGGENKISSTALLPDQSTQSVQITIIYTTAKIITPTPNPVDSPIASSSQIINQTKEEILKKAQAQFNQTEQNLTIKAENILVGYLGTITDIAQNAITLVSDKINLQVSYATDAAFIKNGKAIKPDQLSIKDDVIVIGNMVGNEVLNAKRLVVSPIQSSSIPTKQTIFVTISKINLKTKTLSVTLGQEDQVLSLDKNLKLDLTSIKIGQKIFGVIQPSIEPTGIAPLLLAKIF